MDKIIRILPAEGANPEFAPDRKQQEGIECDGYVLMCFVNEKLSSLHIDGISTKHIADAIRNKKDTEGISIIRQACAVAEGHIRAMEIFNEQQSETAMEKLKDIFAGIDYEEDDPWNE